jgi:hypothetical protein
VGTLKNNNVLISYCNDESRLTVSYWSFDLSPGESVKLPFIAMRTSMLFEIRPSSCVDKYLFVTSINVKGFEELDAPTPLEAFDNHFSLPKTDYAEPGEMIIVEITRMK